MPMRLSGLMSGMDTESIIAQMVEAKKAKVTKAVKAQKSLKYKQDAWKDLNKKILNLYNKSLSNMRFESSFIKKTTKVSNSSVVSVITGENAMNSVQTLKVDHLAKTGFLTGGKIQLADWAEGGELTGSTTLGDLGLIAGESANMNITFKDGRDTERISVTAGTTIDSFVASLREAGLTANFDASNGRIFIASKQSGADQDFNIEATNVAGMEALSALKLNYASVTVTDAEMEKNIDNRVNSLLNSYNDALAQQKTLGNMLKKYSGKVGEVLKVNGVKFDDLFDADGNLKEMDAETLEKVEHAVNVVVKDAQENRQPNVVNDLQGWTAGWKKSVAAIKNVEDNYGAFLKKDANGKTLVDSDGKVAWDETWDVRAKVETDLKKEIADQNALANSLTNNPDSANADLPKKTDGRDSQITLNGVAYTSSRNTFEINGLTLTVNAETAAGEEVTITTEDDVSGVYDMVKNFIKEYNELINEMDKYYNADSAKGYDPLTDEEKEAKSDSAIEEWENKIKDSILRKDSTLGNFASEMKRIMMEGVEVNGKQMYLSNFGIGTLSYFSAPDNEKNAYHIDGDPDDDSTSGNADKLKSMIANDPDTVVSFFTQLSKNLYSKMFDMMKGVEGVSSSMTAYEDKKMQADYDDYTVKIKELEKKLAEYEDKWYAKFAAMETALAKMQNNASAVTSLLGG